MVTAAAENGNFILETAKRPVFIFTNDDIARQLGITKIGVKKHLTKIFAKLNVSFPCETKAECIP